MSSVRSIKSCELGPRRTLTRRTRDLPYRFQLRLALIRISGSEQQVASREQRAASSEQRAGLAPAIRRVPVWAEQQRDVIVLVDIAHAEDDLYFRKKRARHAQG